MKKDIIYILKKIIIGVVIVFCFSFIKSCNVKADTYVYPNVGLLFNNNETSSLAITNSTTGSDFNIKVAVSESTPLFFLIDSCTSQNYNDIEITNTSCTNSCILDGIVTAYKVGSCKINGYNANHVLLQMQIKKYEIDPNSTYYMANSRIRFGGYGYYTQFHILNYYASDEDVITALANQQMQYEDIKNTLNSQTSSIINNQNTNTTTIVNAQEDTTDAINDLNASINDSSGPNLSALNNSAGWLPAGPVDSILNLPIALLSNLTDSLSNSCSPAVLNVPYVNSQITLPCMTSIYEEIGITSWVNTIGIIASAFILFSYLAKLYKWVDDTLTFHENNRIDNWGGI